MQRRFVFRQPAGLKDCAASIVERLQSLSERFGRLLVLIGGSTFSAAQTLVNQLERYTDACFVGEPSGSPPTPSHLAAEYFLE